MIPQIPSAGVTSSKEFSKNILPPSKMLPVIRTDPRENLSSDITSTQQASQFIQRADNHTFSQPGLTPEYWYSVNKPAKKIDVVNDVSEEQWKLSTDYHPVESFVWIESFNSPLYVKLYGLTEDNFWEFFENKWDFGDVIRICDGLLFTTLVQHLENLKAHGAVGSMEMFDYDEEPGSVDTYGTLLQRQKCEAKNAEAGKRKKVQKKSNSGAPFSWQPNYVRKFDFKIYFLCQVSTNYPDGIYKSTSHGEDLKNMKLNKNTRSFMEQRAMNARVHGRTAYALNVLNNRAGDNLKKQVVLKKRTTKSRAPSPAVASPGVSRTHTIAPISKPTLIHTSASNISEKSAEERFRPPHAITIREALSSLDRGPSTPSQYHSSSSENKNCNSIETGLPHFLYDRSDETEDYTEYFNANMDYGNIKASSDTVSINMQNMARKDTTLITLMDILHNRQRARQLGHIGQSNEYLFRARQSAAGQGIDVDSYLASKVTESKEMGNHPLYPPGRVRDLSLRVGEQGKAAVWPAAKKCVIPTISECRNISHTKTTKTKKPQHHKTKEHQKGKTKKKLGADTEPPKNLHSHAKSPNVPKLLIDNHHAVLENLNKKGKDRDESSSLQAVDGGTEHKLDVQSQLDDGKKYRYDKGSIRVSRRLSPPATDNRRVSLEVNLSRTKGIGKPAKSDKRDSVRKQLIAEPIPIDKLLRWEVRKLTKASYAAYTANKKEAEDVKTSGDPFRRSSSYEDILTIQPASDTSLTNYAVLKGHASDTEAHPVHSTTSVAKQPAPLMSLDTNTLLVQPTKSVAKRSSTLISTIEVVHSGYNMKRRVSVSVCRLDKLPGPDGESPAKQSASTRVINSKKTSEDKVKTNVKQEVKYDPKDKVTDQKAINPESTLSFLQHVEYQLPPARKLPRMNLPLDRPAPSQNDKPPAAVNVEEMMSKLSTDVFRGRYRPNHFERMLIGAMRDYKFTLETVISSRGYSIASITIAKPQSNSSSLKYL